MDANSQIRHPGQSKAAARDPEVSLDYWIPHNGRTVSGMTMKC
jgi:hypothetical protein